MMTRLCVDGFAVRAAPMTPKAVAAAMQALTEMYRPEISLAANGKQRVEAANRWLYFPRSPGKMKSRTMSVMSVAVGPELGYCERDRPAAAAVKLVGTEVVLMTLFRNMRKVALRAAILSIGRRRRESC